MANRIILSPLPSLDMLIVWRVDAGPRPCLSYERMIIPPRPTHKSFGIVSRQRSDVRMADELDKAELYLATHLATQMEPLVIRLRTRTLGRVGHQRLIALIAENTLVMGQHEESAKVLDIIARHWRWCPLRYLPVPARWQAWLFARLGL